MDSLLFLIKRFRNLLLFLFLLSLSLFLYFNSSSFHNRIALDTSHVVVGYTFKKVTQLQDYLSLQEQNEKLLIENRKLRNLLNENYYTDTVQIGSKQRYQYIDASIVRKTILANNNNLTIDKGAKHGVKKGMAVVGHDGIVGIVINCGRHFSVVQSILHENTKVSAKELKTNILGSIEWYPDLSYRQILFKDLPKTARLKKTDLVVTSGYGIFPPGIKIGRIDSIIAAVEDPFLKAILNIETKFENIDFVYVIIDRYKLEIDSLNQLKP